MPKEKEPPTELPDRKVKHHDTLYITDGLASLVVAHAASLREVNDFDTDCISPLEQSGS